MLVRSDIHVHACDTMLSLNFKTKKADAIGNLLVSISIGLLFNTSFDLHRATLHLIFRIESNDMLDATRPSNDSTDPILGNGQSRDRVESLRSSHIGEFYVPDSLVFEFFKRLQP